MNGRVFQCYEEHTDRAQYTKTLEQLRIHVKKTMQYLEDLAPLFALEMAEPALTMPDEPEEGATKTQELFYSEKLKRYMRHEDTLVGNLAALHAITWGQCSEAMKTKLRSLDNYQERAEANDCFWLLQKIRGVTLELDAKRHKTTSLADRSEDVV